MELDATEFGVAPRLREVHAIGVCLTLAGLLEKLGIKSRTTLYTMMPDVVELRRGLGPAGGRPYRWLEPDIDAWLKARPQAEFRQRAVAAAIAKRVRGTTRRGSGAKRADQVLRETMARKMVPVTIPTTEE